MRLLADTHAVFWATMERTRLSQSARAALESEENDVLVSVASAWEIAIKVGQGKWPEARDLLFDFERHMDDAGFEMLPIAVAHVCGWTDSCPASRSLRPPSGRTSDD